MFRVGNQAAAKSAAEAFDDRYIPEPNSGCWLWTAALNVHGYGQLQCGGYKGYAHRYAYQQFVAAGADIRGKQVCHKCDVPSCVNPEHLFLGTAADNMADCLRKGRHASQKPTTNYARGVDAARAKLNDRAVKEIRRLKGVLGQRKIAAAFGVTRGAVRCIHSGETWTHV